VQNIDYPVALRDRDKMFQKIWFLTMRMK